MDEIFVNTQIQKQTSSNIFTSILDNLPQFSILENILGTRNAKGKDQTTYRDIRNVSDINS